MSRQEQFWAWVSSAMDNTAGRIVVGLAVLLFVIWMFRPPSDPGICGTCGVDTKRQHHQPWCERGRWGGRQRWRDDP